MTPAILRQIAELLDAGRLPPIERIDRGNGFAVVRVSEHPTGLGPPTRSEGWTWRGSETREASRAHWWDLGPPTTYTQHSIRVIWRERGVVLGEPSIASVP
jgi:hypothetical protein